MRVTVPVFVEITETPTLMLKVSLLLSAAPPMVRVPLTVADVFTVTVLFVPLIVRWLKVVAAEPLIVPAAPVMRTVPELCVNAALFVNVLPAVKVEAVEVSVPEDMRSVLLTVIIPIEIVPLLVKLYSVNELPGVNTFEVPFITKVLFVSAT